MFIFIFIHFKRFIQESIAGESTSDPVDTINWTLCMVGVCVVLCTSRIMRYLCRSIYYQYHHRYTYHHPISTTSKAKTGHNQRYNKEESASQKRKIQKRSITTFNLIFFVFWAYLIRKSFQIFFFSSVNFLFLLSHQTKKKQKKIITKKQKPFWIRNSYKKKSTSKITKLKRIKWHS